MTDISNIKFKNKSFLKEAFVHRSYLNEHPKENLNSNERLEFLGDAVLEFLISKELFKKFPDYQEGKLTALRAALVKTETLAQTAKNLNLGDRLYLSKGEEASGGRENPYLLANTFEAFLGALFLDQGTEKAEEFLKVTLFPEIDDVIEQGRLKDEKSLLQEIAQEKFSVTPQYKVIKEWGPDHNKTFRVGCFLGKKKIAEGEGKSKQTAALAASKKALTNIDNLKL